MTNICVPLEKQYTLTYRVIVYCLIVMANPEEPLLKSFLRVHKYSMSVVKYPFQQSKIFHLLLFSLIALHYYTMVTASCVLLSFFSGIF